jgi:ribosomal protein S18 acetylase RimI-like enzyme
MTELTIHSADPSQFSTMTPWLSSSIRHPERLEQIASLRQFLDPPSSPRQATRNIRIWTAERSGKVVGTEIGHLESSRWATIWGPILDRSEPTDTRNPLHRRVLADLQREGIEYLQTTVPRDDQDSLESLLEIGFHHVAQIDVLGLQIASPRYHDRHNPRPTTGDSRPEGLPEYDEGSDPPDWRITRLAPHQEQELARVLKETYEGSLDCPWLNNLRTVDEAMAGFRQAGLLTPNTTFLIQSNGRPIGCLLLAPTLNPRDWHLHYWGLSPHVRGKGWGEFAVRWGVRTAASHGANTLSLAVDRANQPALDIYFRVGFEPRVFRNVLLQGVGSRAEEILESLPHALPTSENNDHP